MRVTRWVVVIGLAAMMTIFVRTDAGTPAGPRTRARPTAGARTPPPVSLATPPPDGPGWNYAYIGRSSDQRLEHVVATGPADAWAVGNGRHSRLLLHFDGRSWEEHRLPALPRGVALSFIAASGPDNAWLFGTTLTPAHYAWRWDGSRWHDVPFPEKHIVLDAEVFAPDDVWTVGNHRESLHWDGTRWRTVPMPAVARAISAVAADDMWAVGLRETPGGRQLSQPAAMRWNGHTWRLMATPVYHFRMSVPEPSAELTDVVALSADEAWTFGDQTFNHGEMDSEDPPDPPAILLHWNGMRWTRQPPTPRLGTCCRLLSPDGKGGIMLVNRSAWTRTADGRFAKPPAPPEFTGLGGKTSFVFENVANVPGTSRLWGVGVIGHGEAGNNWSRVAIVRYR
jgi:hypothetical protein